MDFEEGIELINYAFEQKKDEMLFQRWIAAYQHLSFDEFKAELEHSSIDNNKTTEEILKEVKDILTMKWR